MEIIIEAIPDMSTDELSELEFAIGVELQDRAAKADPHNVV